MAEQLRDVVVVLPGIMGSVLRDATVTTYGSSRRDRS